MSPLRRDPSRRLLPTAGELRRERRVLVRIRDERVRDLGGILLEMFKRDRFREDLIMERCGELAEIDERMEEIDLLLGISRGRVPYPRCACGAPVPIGSHFCPNCGRPAGDSPVVACTRCGYALAADAAYCPHCGTAAGGSLAGLEAAPQAALGNGSAPVEAVEAVEAAAVDAPASFDDTQVHAGPDRASAAGGAAPAGADESAAEGEEERVTT